MSTDPEDMEGMLNDEDDETAQDYLGLSAPSGGGGLSALDVPGAAEALAKMARSSQQARAALQRAREQIIARRYPKALPWLEISAALSKPTRTGAIGEVFGNVSEALAPSVREREAFKQGREKELLGIDTQMAGLDKSSAETELQLAALRARLGNERARMPMRAVKLPNGKTVWLRNDTAEGLEAGSTTAPPEPTYSIVQQPLPDGTTRPMRVNNRTGEMTPAGASYTPVTKLSGSQIAQTKAKLGTIRVLKSQLAAIRDKWKPIKGTMSAGYLQGWIPTEEGKQFDKAVDAARGTIRQLTRTPGEGSMSNYEGILDQAKMPARGEYEAASEDAMDYLDQLIRDYEASALEVLGMPVGQKPPGAGAAAPSAPPAEEPPPTQEEPTNPDDEMPAVEASFATEAEAEAAFKAKKIQKGSRIMINGVPGKWQ